MEYNKTEEFNSNLIYKYLIKAFMEKDQRKQESLVILIKRLQKGGK